MKPILKYLYALAAILMLCGCEDKPNKKIVRTGCEGGTAFSIYKTGAIWLDTITIHGKSHEILLRRTSTSREAVGGMMHSPECWCGKGGVR